MEEKTIIQQAEEEVAENLRRRKISYLSGLLEYKARLQNDQSEVLKNIEEKISVIEKIKTIDEFERFFAEGSMYSSPINKLSSRGL